jgi:hypothetical protein
MNIDTHTNTHKHTQTHMRIDDELDTHTHTHTHNTTTITTRVFGSDHGDVPIFANRRQVTIFDTARMLFLVLTKNYTLIAWNPAWFRKQKQQNPFFPPTVPHVLGGGFNYLLTLSG